MRRSRTMVILAVCAALAACAKERVVPQADAGPVRGSSAYTITQALAAGPDWLSSLATIAEWPPIDTAQFVIVRAGPGGWTCFPDLPTTPRNDPMCVDDQFLRWLTAWRGHARGPAISEMAIAYALRGFQVASATDPTKTRPDSGAAWVEIPASVLIAMPNAPATRGLPAMRPASGPWMLWAGTPWALSVVPVTAPAAAPPSRGKR